jgi:hypothetical protein
MSKNIYFFQHYHNGDLFVTKEFVRQIVEELSSKFNFGYYHNNNPKTLLDLNIPLLGNTERFGKDGMSFPRFIEPDADTLYINTHYLVYGFSQPISLFKPVGINHDSMRLMWSHIFEKINQKFNTNLKLKQKEHYIGKINFSFFDISNVDSFLKKRHTKKLLFSNGKPMSKQSFRQDMNDIIIDLSSRFQHWDFICTEKFKNSNSNVFFTDDIIKEKELQITPPNWCKPFCDLNEISYLSEHCEIIIGKNSGPFIYCITQKNLLDSKKIIVSLNKEEKDSLLWGINFNATYRWSNVFDCNSTKKIIEEFL